MEKLTEKKLPALFVALPFLLSIIKLLVVGVVQIPIELV